jgi:hypothetical protein
MMAVDRAWIAALPAQHRRRAQPREPGQKVSPRLKLRSVHVAQLYRKPRAGAAKIAPRVAAAHSLRLVLGGPIRESA